MTIEINIPDIGTDEFEVIDILTKTGDLIKIDQPLIVIEGNKTSIEIPSPYSGIVKEITVSIGDKVKTGHTIMIFNSVKNKETILYSDKEEQNFSLKNEAYFHATPLIRRLAREFNINLLKVCGTGRKGRILHENVRDYIKNAIKIAETSSDRDIHLDVSRKLSEPQTDSDKLGNQKEIKLSYIKKTSGEKLHRNWIMIPHVTHFDLVDITDLENFRKQQNLESEKNHLDIKITPIIFIMKAVSNALEKMPIFNSSLSKSGNSLIYNKHINIGIAVDTLKGLLVPVIKDVNKKSIISLARETRELVKKARNINLSQDDMQGGCFTISSIGNLGTTHFTPIINAPEVAILGISKISMQPVWNGTKFLPRLMLPISLSFDHRVIDGADGARFITKINHILKDIRYLLM